MRARVRELLHRYGNFDTGGSRSFFTSTVIPSRVRELLLGRGVETTGHKFCSKAFMVWFVIVQAKIDGGTPSIAAP